MASDRSVNSSHSVNEVPASLEEFVGKAYAKDNQPLLIADGSMNQLDDYNTAQKAKEKQPACPPEQKLPPIDYPQQPPPTDYPRQTPPVYCPQPPLTNSPGYYYQPGTTHCRRQYAPVFPVLPQPIDIRKTYRHPDNPVVQATRRLALELDQHPIMDTHPSEISRQDPSACFLNMILQKTIGRQWTGNTVEQIAYNLDNLKDPTNHFYKHPLGEEMPGDIIIAYPKGGYRAEAAIYLGKDALGHGLVASFDPNTKRITAKDDIKNFYPPQDPSKAIYNKVTLYRWASWNSGY